MKRIFLFAFIIMSQSAFAGGLFFNVTNNGNSLSIKTTIPNHVYPKAGIKINTVGFSLAVGSECTPANNGYCIFSVSDTTPARISVTGNGSAYSATICLNGTGVLSCQQFNNLNYQPSRFVYVGNYGESPSVSLCFLDESTGLIQSCQDSCGGIPNNFGANGIAFNNAKTAVFLTGFSGTTVYQCAVNAVTGLFSSCTTTDITTPTGYSAEYGFLTLNPSNTLVYIADNSGRILACPIVNNAISPVCVDTGATGIETSVSGIALNNAGTTAYITNYGPPVVNVCAVNGSTFSSCVDKTGGGAFTFTEPGGVVLNNDETIVYIADYSAGRVYGCSTTPTQTNTFANCFIATSGLENLWGIALNAGKTIAYITNFGTPVYICPILADGTFAECAVSNSVSEGTGIALL